jgi:hypothetical protein
VVGAASAQTITEFATPTQPSAPSGPAVIARRLLAGVGTGNSWKVPVVVSRPILSSRIGRLGPLVPVSKDDCKDGGWRAFGFRNQGQCVASVQRGPKP